MEIPDRKVKIEIYRFQSEILMRLFKKRAPVSADILCREAKMSVSSLRKTIDEINQGCAVQGMQIVSKAGRIRSFASESSSFSAPDTPNLYSDLKR